MKKMTCGALWKTLGVLSLCVLAACAGDDGSQGDAGLRGLQGEPGPTGPQGELGEKGEPADVSALELLNRRLDLRDLPGRHTAAWDAMFDFDVPRAELLLADLITEDCVITFKFPGQEFDSPPGAQGWIAVVTGSAEAGGWVPANPGHPRAIHMAGSVNIMEETPTSAVVRMYIRASHYGEDTTVDFSEAVLDLDVIYDEEGGVWRTAHLDLTPLSLREEGGMVLPPVTSD